MKVLEHVSPGREARSTLESVKADLLERTGQYSRSRTVAERLLNSRDLNPSDRAACELVMARLDWDQSDVDSAIVRLQRSISIASKSGDLERRFWSELRLMSLLCDKLGPEGTVPLISELRQTSTSLGDPTAIAALHVFIGQMEAKRGLFVNARRHLRLGKQTLAKSPNLWLEATLESVMLGISILFCNIDAGIKAGEAALALGEQSGATSPTVSSLGNLGNLYFSMGRFEEATSFQERAMALVPSGGEQYVSCVESLARIQLAKGDLVGCQALLDEVGQAVRGEGDLTRYVHRHAELTRASLLERLGRVTEAIHVAERAIHLAEISGDHHLYQLGTLLKAELNIRNGQVTDSLTILESAALELIHQPGTLHAQYERILALALSTNGEIDSAQRHYRRAARLYRIYNDVPGAYELDRSLPTFKDASECSHSGGVSNIADALQAFAAIAIHTREPETLAQELLPLLIGSGAVTSAAVTSQHNSEGQRQIAYMKSSDSPPNVETVCRTLRIGECAESVEVQMQCRTDIESVATINAVKLLVHTIHDLERARLEREERATLWPIDELPLDNGQAVAVGEMRKLLALARRIASTNVSVLITGESGTGKEILARAVHAFSARAAKPFVAMNCTAIPRDLLESQMFGHRRGAFTGADRDHLGVIRAARDGTLFLDEIGEMGLDLQPKILRFLESGEISPLGDPEPVNVNVRIVAATNTNLEDLVRDGRFREDLFYRLNVFRLSIPPLRKRRDEIPSLVNEFVRRAALEFHKGHVRVSEETMEHLLVYSWPGNIRQLQNELRRIVALAEPNSIVAPGDIAAEIRAALPIFPSSADGRHIAVSLNERLMPTLNRIEGEMIKIALRDHGGKVDAAARALGISRKGLYLKRQRLGL
jgi:hydrogenase-4 transcriptional activator